MNHLSRGLIALCLIWPAWGQGLQGEWVNPEAPSAPIRLREGTFQGEHWLFRGDGTFRYSIAGQSQDISGVSLISGRYTVQGQSLRLSGCRESWYPQGSNKRQNQASFRDKARPDADGDYLFHSAGGRLKIPAPTAPRFRSIVTDYTLVK